MGQRLCFPSEGRRAEDFFALKNPTASAPFETANLGTKGQHVVLALCLELYNYTVLQSHCTEIQIMVDKAACIPSVVQHADSRNYGDTQSWLLQVGSSENRNLSLCVLDSTITRLLHHANSTGRNITTVKRVKRRSQNVRKRTITSVFTKLIWSSPLNLCMIHDTLCGLSLRPFIQSSAYWSHSD